MRESLLRIRAIATGDMICSIFDLSSQVMLFIMSFFFGIMAALMITIVNIADIRDQANTGHQHVILATNIDAAPDLRSYLAERGFTIVAYEGSVEDAIGKGKVIFEQERPLHDVLIQVINAPDQPDGILLKMHERTYGVLDVEPGGDLFMAMDRWRLDRLSKRLAARGDPTPGKVLSDLIKDNGDGPVKAPSPEKAEKFAHSAPGALVLVLLFTVASLPVSGTAARMAGGELSRGGYEPLMCTPVRAWEFTVGRLASILSFSACGTIIFVSVIEGFLVVSGTHGHPSAGILIAGTLAMVCATSLIHLFVKGLIGIPSLYKYVMILVGASFYIPVALLVMGSDAAADWMSPMPYLGLAAAIWKTAVREQVDLVAFVESLTGTGLICVALLWLSHKTFKRDAYLFRD